MEGLDPGITIQQLNQSRVCEGCKTMNISYTVNYVGGEGIPMSYGRKSPE